MTELKAIVPGATVTPFKREGTFQHWARYAGVNYEYADHHMDDEVGRHEGFPAAFGMAPLIHAYLHSMLRNWIDPDNGRVISIGMQLRKPFLHKRTLTASGTVKAVREEAGELHIELDIWADDDTGDRLVNGTAKVAIQKSA